MRKYSFFIPLIPFILAFGLCASTAYATGRIVMERWTFEEESTESDLYLFEQGSEGFTSLPIWGQYPTLDPSGKLIAYYSFSPTPGIYVTDIQGKRSQKVVALSEFTSPTHQEWAPDGQSLVVDIEEDIEEFSPGAESWSGESLINWSGEQIDPTLSGDGRKLAFLSNTNPAGEAFGTINTFAVFVANADGSEPEQIGEPDVLTDPATAEEFILDRQHISLSPDGTQLALSAFVEGPEEEWEDEEIITVDTATEHITELTHTKGYISDPDWLPDGDIAYIHYTYGGEYWKEDQLMKVSSEGGEPKEVGPETEAGGQKWIASISGLQPANLPELNAESGSRAEALLYKYAPTLRYDSLESYRAIGVSSIADLYSGEEAEDSNRIVDEAGEPIAYSNLKLSKPSLNLGFLQGAGEDYAETERPVAESDRLVERENYESDAAELQANPAIADRVYGHPVFEGGRWWLEYWLWYYYDEFNLFGFGDHEGDWELVMVELSKTGEPVDAVYAQHHDSEADRCKFVDLNWDVGPYGNVSPSVYVARGTHASYVRPGLLLGSPPLDEADGEGYVARPLVLPMAGKGWAAWPGRWGNSLGEGMSPMAPISQTSRWDEPQQFLEQAEGCPTEEEGAVLSRLGARAAHARRVARPLPPVLSHPRIKGGRVNVHYRVRRRPGEAQPLGIDVSVLSSHKSVTPTHRALWHVRRGVISVPLPGGPGPYEVVGLTGTARGVNSKRVSVRVRHARPGKTQILSKRQRSVDAWVHTQLRTENGSERGMGRAALERFARHSSAPPGLVRSMVRPFNRR